MALSLALGLSPLSAKLGLYKGSEIGYNIWVRYARCKLYTIQKWHRKGVAERLC